MSRRNPNRDRNRDQKERAELLARLEDRVRLLESTARSDAIPLVFRNPTADRAYADDAATAAAYDTNMWVWNDGARWNQSLLYPIYADGPVEGTAVANDTVAVPAASTARDRAGASDTATAPPASTTTDTGAPSDTATAPPASTATDTGQGSDTVATETQAAATGLWNATELEPTRPRQELGRWNTIAQFGPDPTN